MASSTVLSSDPASDQNVLGSINVDDILNNIYSDEDGGGDPPLKTAEEVWNEIVAGKEPQMTLEDFLTKAGAVAPDDVAAIAPQFQGYGVGIGGFESGDGSRERGKRRAVEPPVDKVTQQRQRRMIKNRESAARSRERKQAYTVELEALVMQLEEENARLVREEIERSRKRYKKLMENLIPIVEKQRPVLRAHRRVHSVGW